MKYVIVRCEELGEEEAFPLEKGEAYVPVVSKMQCCSFRDVYGGRYLNMSHRRLPVMDKRNCWTGAIEVYPDHPILKLRACERVVKKGIETGRRSTALGYLKSVKAKSGVREKLLGLITDHYCRKAVSEQKKEKTAVLSWCRWINPC